MEALGSVSILNCESFLFENNVKYIARQSDWLSILNNIKLYCICINSYRKTIMLVKKMS